MTDNGSTTREEDVPPLSDAVTQDEDVAQGGHASASVPSNHDGASDAADNSSKSRGRSKLGWMLGVVGIAALLERSIKPRGPVVIVISGRNLGTGQHLRVLNGADE